MNGAQIVDLGDTPKLVGGHLYHRRKNRDHGVVNPDVDRAKTLFSLSSKSLHRVCIGDIASHNERGRPHLMGFASGALQSLAGPGNQAELVTTLREGPGRRPSDAARGSGDDRHLVRHECRFIIRWWIGSV